VLFGLAVFTLAALQRVQNLAAQLVLRLDHHAHIKPAFRKALKTFFVFQLTRLIYSCVSFVAFVAFRL